MDPPLAKIEIFSRWTGFADPCHHEGKLTIRPCANRFLREVAVEGKCEELRTECVRDFMSALEWPMLPLLMPSAFDQPFEVVRQHYDSCWTDDYPELLVRITNTDGTVTCLRSTSQHAFMLPLQFIDTTADSTCDTYDPQLSRAIAALMPESFLNRDRLASYGVMFQADLDRSNRAENSGSLPSDEVEPAPETAKASDESQVDGIEAIIHRLFSGEESPEEKDEAELTGNHSQRLLKRIPLQELCALLERGADPNVADDVGQTALMYAAFPPFQRERFERLVKAGADLEARRKDGANGLQFACEGGEFEAAAAWVAAGADVNAATSHGATPLMLGAKWDNIVSLLLAHNAAINTVDHDGHSALAYAVLLQSSIGAKRLLNSIRALLAAGADVRRPDRQSLTPLDHAYRSFARVELQNEVLQAFAESRTAEERRQAQAARAQHMQWLEQYRREHLEDERLTNADYDDRTLAMEIVELLTAAAKDM